MPLLAAWPLLQPFLPALNSLTRFARYDTKAVTGHPSALGRVEPIAGVSSFRRSLRARANRAAVRWQIRERFPAEQTSSILKRPNPMPPRYGLRRGHPPAK